MKAKRGGMPRSVLVGLGLAVAAAIVALPALDVAQGAQSGGGKGGGGAKDLDVCITLVDAGNSILSDDGTANGPAYCASERGITAFVGRRRSITLGLGDKPNQTRRVHLWLDVRLDEIAGDPDPDFDGGIVGGGWSNHPLPEIDPEGIVGSLEVAYRQNVLFMGEPGFPPSPNEVLARFTWFDAEGTRWRLLWGPGLQPGDAQLTNPYAPWPVVTRRPDGQGGFKNEWDVTTTVEDETSLRDGLSTAFLWRESDRTGTADYWGAFNVSFAYSAIEEP